MNYLLLTETRLSRWTSPLIISDELIEHLGHLYLSNPRIARLGISFEVFASDPQSFIGAEIAGLVALDQATEFLRLLPAQRAVRSRMDAAEAGQLELELHVSEVNRSGDALAAHNGALVEKLRHHAWPKGPAWRPRANEAAL